MPRHSSGYVSDELVVDRFSIDKSEDCVDPFSRSFLQHLSSILVGQPVECPRPEIKERCNELDRYVIVKEPETRELRELYGNCEFA